MYFTRLDDSPMFRKQMQSIEEGAELLRERCLKYHKGCRKYTERLGEAYDGDIAFASSLEAFGGGHNDPISVAFGASSLDGLVAQAPKDPNVEGLPSLPRRPRLNATAHQPWIDTTILLVHHRTC